MTKPEHRFARASLLRSALKDLERARQVCDFRQGLYIDYGGQEFVESSGILLSIERTDRYLKLSGDVPGNQGSDMAAALGAFGIGSCRTILDVGANFGEVALYFAKKFPEARIVAVEPNPRNLEVLRRNIDVQFFSPCIEVHEVAIASGVGVAWLDDRAASSKISSKANSGRSGVGFLVETIGLVGLFERAALATVDFVKIDIEGSEIELLEDVRRLTGHVRAWLIEHSEGTDGAEFARYVDLFADAGFDIYERGREHFLLTPEAARARILDAEPNGDYWFVQSSRPQQI